MYYNSGPGVRPFSPYNAFGGGYRVGGAQMHSPENVFRGGIGQMNKEGGRPIQSQPFGYQQPQQYQSYQPFMHQFNMGPMMGFSPMFSMGNPYMGGGSSFMFGQPQSMNNFAIQGAQQAQQQNTVGNAPGRNAAWEMGRNWPVWWRRGGF